MEPEKGFRRGYAYRRIEAAHYARKFEIKSRLNQMVACNTKNTHLLTGEARRPAHELHRQRRPCQKQIRRRTQQVPAERAPMQREGARQREVAVDKRINALVAALNVAMCGIATIAPASSCSVVSDISG